MYKGKNIYLNFIAFSVLLKKKRLFVRNHLILLLSFFLLCAGCEEYECIFVLINGDYLSATGKLTTEERQKRRVGGEGGRKKERKQFETVSNWEEWREEGKPYLVAFDRRRQAG